MGEINLGTLLAQRNVPKLGTTREKIEYIDIGLIDDDPRNFYKLSALDELAANIELLGLQQPIRVRPNPEDPNRVIIVSGHRRRAAIRKLAAENPERWRLVPCIRDQNGVSSALQELRLIYANSDTRKISDAELSKQAERVEMLLYQLKEEGYEFPGRMRDHVAQACRISKSKLGRLKVIREGLADVWCELWGKNKLPEQAAYTLARMPGDFQRRLYKVTNGSIHGNSVERVLTRYEDGWRWEPTLTCPGGKVCTHADAALRHDLDNYDMCGGVRCCLDCEQAKREWSPCERMCSKAKEQRRETAAQKEAEQEKEKQKTYRKYQRTTQLNAQRLVKAIEAAGLEDQESIEWDRYGGNFSVATIRDFAAGIFAEGMGFHSERLSAKDLSDPVKVAQQLGCTTDFLLGLTDQLTPDAANAQRETEQLCESAEAWGWGEPTESGLYWCVVGPMKGGGKMYWWNGQDKRWESPSAVCSLNVTPICWMKCPELPESLMWYREVLDGEDT